MKKIVKLYTRGPIKDGKFTKRLLGIFKISETGDRILFTFVDSDKPLSDAEFVKEFGESYQIRDRRVSMKDPEDYLNNLRNTQSSIYSWHEEENIHD